MYYSSEIIVAVIPVLNHYVNTLGPGDAFRDWLVDTLGDRIKNKYCKVEVFKYSPSSHTVCRYKFKGEKYSVIVKFFAEPTGELKRYNASEAMVREYNNLMAARPIINVPMPIAIHQDFNCALVTEYISGRSLTWYLSHENDLYDKLTSVAHMQHRLHEHTRHDYYDKKKDFANFHKVLDHLNLDRPIREHFDQLLGKWWYSSLLDLKQGCMIHRDATPSNYMFRKDILYVLDLESSWYNAHYALDLGIMCSELKNHFQLQRGSGELAEPYIGHFLWHYSKNESDFLRITKIVPFFMGLGFLRSARLHRHYTHHKYLIKEAAACLTSLE
ncbi:phosphotransferase [Methanomethylovorans sp.]|uniref:phosphotransferase n=1 Tax=Methanomethylovorans sp. TaxID=2758717 RepID=UPI000B0C255A|nr:phosphotransferase [Methanomethylovorans sp.]